MLEDWLACLSKTKTELNMALLQTQGGEGEVIGVKGYRRGYRL